MADDMGTRHLGWIAACGVPGVLAGSAMIAYWLAAADPTRELPLWPLWPLGLATALCLYMVFAPLIHAPPFRRKREPATLPTQQLNMDKFHQLREATRPPDLESDGSPGPRIAGIHIPGSYTTREVAPDRDITIHHVMEQEHKGSAGAETSLQSEAEGSSSMAPEEPSEELPEEPSDA